MLAIYSRGRNVFGFGMPVVTRKMTDLKEGILAKIDEKFNEIKTDFLTEIKEQMKNEVTAAINNEIKKRLILTRIT